MMVLRRWLSRGLIALARIYQRVISPWLPPACRFQPSCSEYFIESVKKRGPIVGAWRGLWRVCRCGPWSKGGYDPP
jgi:putative membrane protein insertion efficiency factor